MNYVKRFGLISLAIMFFVSILTINSSAQVRGRVSIGSRGAIRPVAPRRVIIRRNPFYNNGFYGRGFYGRSYWGDPFWGNSFYNDPYYTNPRLRELADRVHNENEVRRSRKKIREYTQKFNQDGYLTDKERKKLEKAYREYNKDVARLRDGG